jgi:hypothetical protein
VSRELIRVAILWQELWHEGLEEASRLFFSEKNPAGMIAVLDPLHDTLEAVSFSKYRVSYDLIVFRARPQPEKPHLFNSSGENYTKLAKLVAVIVHMVMLVNWTKPGISTMGYVGSDGRLKTLTY